MGDKEEIEMVGREKEKKDILHKMSQKDQEKSIIPVVAFFKEKTVRGHTMRSGVPCHFSHTIFLTYIYNI